MESLKGNLLIAGAGIAGEVFRQTVVIMAEHDEKGALGFVLNRPSHALLENIAPSLSGIDGMDERLYLGGPVQPEVVVILAEYGEVGDPEQLIFDSVGFAPPEDPEGVEGRVLRAKAFSGYAGWGPGQLESEMDDGGWLVEPARPDDVFASDPDALWRDVVRRKGSQFTLLSTMPFDPSSN
ncbi:MAG: putative transcriptional regulator [Actinomycetota bacterium]|jgi:putative transcriptional regulator|nr:putative transcriptional regulator [Actinomycetota bacterium]